MSDLSTYIGVGIGALIFFGGKKALEPIISQGGFVRPVSDEGLGLSEILEDFGYHSQEEFYCKKPAFSECAMGKLIEKMGYFKE